MVIPIKITPKERLIFKFLCDTVTPIWKSFFILESYVVKVLLINIVSMNITVLRFNDYQWCLFSFQLDAVLETYHTTQDLQGGNTGNLLLAKGDSVSIRHNDGLGSHLEGSNRLRITSFSGFLIYPVEASIIVGK